MKTDLELQQDVLAELRWQPSIDAAGIGVEVKDGIVTLAGHVNSHAEKWDAERAAQCVAGVKALAVEIDVRLPDFSKRNDADIARSAENALQWLSYLQPSVVRIMVEGGWVTLSGEVFWEHQRQAAVGAVRFLMGVTGVSDQIVIKPKRPISPIKTEIEAAIKRRCHNTNEHILVEVLGDQVTLSGTVHSWAEREQARQSAWAADGVSKVMDNMVLAY